MLHIPRASQLSEQWENMIEKAMRMPGEWAKVRYLYKSPWSELPVWKGPDWKEQVGWTYKQGQEFQIWEVQVSQDRRRICARVGDEAWVNIAHFGRKRDRDQYPVW